MLLPLLPLQPRPVHLPFFLKLRVSPVPLLPRFTPVSGISFHFRGLISPPSPYVRLLKYDGARTWQMNSQSECAHSPSSLPSAAPCLSPRATHSTSPPRRPPLPPLAVRLVANSDGILRKLLTPGNRLSTSGRKRIVLDSRLPFFLHVRVT